VLQAKLFDNCIGAFNDGRSAAWAGATPAGCPYGDPLLATAWACGWRAGQAEQATVKRCAGPRRGAPVVERPHAIVEWLGLQHGWLFRVCP